MRCKLLLLVALCVLSGGVAHVANLVYISSVGAGDQSGLTDCTHAKPFSYFNSGANWNGSPSGVQIGPDTTVHLCGSNTLGSGATALTFQGSGTSGHPITLLFEPNARLSSPVFNNGIASNGKSFIVIDGGVNGIIENTRAGTTGAACSGGACNSGDVFTAGVYVTTTSSFEVKNLTVQNIYVRSYGGGDGGQSTGIQFDTSTMSNVHIHDNHVNNAHAAIFFSSYQNISAIEIDHNTTVNHVWGIAALDNNGSSAATTVSVHDNDISGFEVWGGVGGFHQDGIFFSVANGTIPAGATFTNSKIFNNRISGAMTNPSTGDIYISGSSGGMSGIAIFGNLMIMPHNSHGQGSDDAEGCIVIGFSAHASAVVNNTCVSDHTPLIDMRDSNQSNVTLFKNNIGMGFSSGVPMYEFVNNKNDTNVSGGIWNNNEYMYAIATHLFAINDGGTNYTTIAAWTAHCGCDGASFISDPLLNATTFVPAAGSPAISAGVNLSGLGIPELLVDRNGVARGGGAWTIGALAAGGVTPPSPGPPPVLFSQAILNVLPAPVSLPAPTLARLTPSSTYRGVSGFSQDGKVWNASLTVTATGANLCAMCFTYDGAPVMASCMSPNACTLLLSTASVPVPTVLTAHVIAVAMPVIAVPVLQ